MSLQSALINVLSTPSPSRLWQLRSDLLAAGLPLSDPIFSVVDRFHEFLTRVMTDLAPARYQELFGLLNMGTLGGIVVSNLLEAEGMKGLWKQLMADGVSRSVLALSASGSLKPAGTLEIAVYEDAGWFLYEELWKLSAETRPQIDPPARRLAVDRLIDPIRRNDLDSVTRAVLISYLYEVVLVTYFSLRFTELD